MKYKIADLIVKYDSKYDLLKKRSEKYKVDESSVEDYSLYVENEHIEREKKKYPFISDLEAEYMVMGTTFYKLLLNEGGCLLHSSCVVIDDEAYLFSGNCGAGKSTHTSLWLKYLENKKPYILNDDKPAVRIENDEVYVYGTPFSGKNDISENKKVKVKGICFIEQSKSNSINKLESKEALTLFMNQTIRKLNEEEMLKLFDVLDKILNSVSIYKLCCDMSKEAVELSYKTMRGENTNEN